MGEFRIFHSDMKADSGLRISLVLFCLVIVSSCAPVGYGSAKYVLMVGIDGLGSNYFNSSSVHPNLDSLILSGSSSMIARNNFPTDSKPNWAAVLSGAGPEETGVDSNSWYYLPNCINYGVIDPRCVACETCDLLVPLVQLAFENDETLYNATIDVIEAVLHDICNQLSFPLKATCNTFVDLFVQQIFNSVVLNQTVAEICDELHACRNQLSPLNGPGQKFPTMFKAVKYYNPLMTTVCYTDHSVVVNLLEKNMVDEFMYAPGNSSVLVDYLVPLVEGVQPELVFIHFDNIDDAGHNYGWGSQQYLDAIEDVDTLLGTLLGGYSSTGILDETLVLVTSDHGGQGTGHGYSDNANVLIPWIASGPGIMANQTLSTYVRNMDTPSTALYALGISAPPLWQGNPIYEAWTGTPVNHITPNRISHNVVVVVISGLTASAIEEANMPVFTSLLSNGASTLQARSVMPSTSLTNIASIIMGAGPEETGICSGTVDQPCSWNPPPATPALDPTAEVNGLFPSIFELLGSQPYNYSMAACYSWSNVSELFDPSQLSFNYQNSSDGGVALAAVSEFQFNPNFTLVQFNEVQEAGLKHGYNSSEYIKSVEAADGYLGTVVNGLQYYLPGAFVSLFFFFSTLVTRKLFF